MYTSHKIALVHGARVPSTRMASVNWFVGKNVFFWKAHYATVGMQPLRVLIPPSTVISRIIEPYYHDLHKYFYKPVVPLRFVEIVAAE